MAAMLLCLIGIGWILWFNLFYLLWRMWRLLNVSSPIPDPDIETEELFVLKTKGMKKTIKKTIEIHDFNRKREGENRERMILSPFLKLSGKI